MREHPKRALCLLLGLSLPWLGLDSAIAHFADKERSNLNQWIPVLFGPLAAIWSVYCSRPGAREKTFVVGLRAAGLVSILVGGLGTWFHVSLGWKNLGDDVSGSAIEKALAVAPPLFAPGAFCVLGAAFWILTSDVLVIQLRKGATSGR